uniref:Putative dihydroxyactetone-phosphate acyltransferase dhapat n=1 Tax=Ornithodoros turicata TaxID=34597 RepID=A0A2R5LN71_9ACAR
MGHNMKMGNIRFLGYVLSKCYKSMYRSLYVHSKGMEKYRKMALENPILLLPTHRSYNDFLLMSYVCFYYDVPLPVIAAGLDFLGMPAVTMLLRNGGAFFIRRTFGSDQLYWEVFREYVHTLVVGGEHPVEFFVEGTRSRTAKSLCPRTGLLHTALEMFFTSRVSDINIIPITITYDRTLEENLYAYELLGVPKPKESTSGLVKARGILNDNYGDIFIRFGDPISVRSFCDPHVDRTFHALQPRFITHHTPAEAEACARLARRVIKAHHGILAMSPFPLLCLVLHSQLSRLPGIATAPADKLAEEVLWLRRFLRRAGVVVKFHGTESGSSLDWLRREINTHSYLLRLSPSNEVEFAKGSKKKLKASKDPKNSSLLRIKSNTVEAALPRMLLYHYGNQALQVLAPACMAALVLVTTPVPRTHDVLFENFKRLQNLLQREFVFEMDKLENNFHDTVEVLRHVGALGVPSSSDMDTLSDDSIQLLNSLASHVMPFLKGFQIVCEFLVSRRVSEVDVPIPELVRQCQCAAEEAILNGRTSEYHVLSLDLLNNCLLCLTFLGAAKKEVRKEGTVLVPNADEVTKVLHSIKSFLPGASQFSAEELPLLRAKL